MVCVVSRIGPISPMTPINPINPILLETPGKNQVGASLPIGRTVYWTGFYDPRREAVSKQIQALRSLSTSSRVVSLSPGALLSFGANHVLRVHPRLWRWTARILAPWAARHSDIHHIFYSFPPAPFLARLRGRRIVMTAVSEPPREWRASELELNALSRIAAECERDREALVAASWPAGRVSVILPGVDLDEFAPAASCAPGGASPGPCGSPFRILFASVPFLPGYAQARGMDILVSAARLLPDVRFRLAGRGGPANTADTRGLLGEETAPGASALPPNIEITQGNYQDMRRMYRECCAAVAPFRRSPLNKSCPHSLIECLALGRPVLASNETGIAPLLEAQGCAEIFPPSAEGLAAAIERLRSRYDSAAREARPCAERHFSMREFLAKYREFYEITRGCG